RIVTLSAALMLAVGTASAVHVWEDAGGWWNEVTTYGGAPLYAPNELSLDLFGSYVAPEEHFTKLFETNIRHGTWGGGAGLNYFLTRELGIAGDINIGHNGGTFVDLALDSLIL